VGSWPFMTLTFTVGVMWRHRLYSHYMVSSRRLIWINWHGFWDVKLHVQIMNAFIIHIQINLDLDRFVRRDQFHQTKKNVFDMARRTAKNQEICNITKSVQNACSEVPHKICSFWQQIWGKNYTYYIFYFKNLPVVCHAADGRGNSERKAFHAELILNKIKQVRCLIMNALIVGWLELLVTNDIISHVTIETIPLSHMVVERHWTVLGDFGQIMPAL